MIVVTVARRPLEGTVAKTVTIYGTGALNIGSSRVAGTPEGTRFDPSKHSHEGWRMTATGEECVVKASQFSGRWPSNVIIQHSSLCQKLDSTTEKIPNFGSSQTSRFNPGECHIGVKISRVGFREESVDRWSCAPGCPVHALGDQSGVTISSIRVGGEGEHLDQSQEDWRFRRVTGGFQDTGTAARFFKQVQK